MTEIAQNNPLSILEVALANGRLAHALLFQGAGLETLDEAARALAGKLLTTGKAAQHPDYFCVRPANKMRRISTDDIRALNRSIQQTANQGGRKVAVVFEADRLQTQAANAFLKTLEEPPPDTTIVLITTRPYDLLPTIRSRCLLVNFPTEQDRIASAEWRQWLQDYGDLLSLVSSGVSRNSAPEMILSSYGLITRFVGIKDNLSSAAWKEFKATLPETLEDDQLVAMETGFMKSLRGRMFAEMEEQTRNAALQTDDIALAGRRLDSVVQLLEKSAGLLELNFQEAAALEHFILSSLRIWARN